MADRDIEAVKAGLATIEETAMRLHAFAEERASSIVALEQIVIELQHRIDSPAAEAIEAVMHMAKFRNCHWLNIFHLHWAESLDASLALILSEYKRILAER